MDRGDVHFHVDFETGTVAVGVRPPLSLPSGRVVATIPILEFLDRAAELTLAMNAAQREAMQRLHSARVQVNGPALSGPSNGYLQP